MISPSRIFLRGRSKTSNEYPSSKGFNKKTSTAPPVDLCPNKRAGITLLLLTTKREPAGKYLFK